MVKLLRNKLSGLDEHTLEVVKKSSSSTLVKVMGMIVGLAVSIALGRLLGPDGLGVINLSSRIINILIVIGLFGMRQVIVKEVAIANNKKNDEHIGNVMFTAFCINGVLTLLISIALILSAPWIANNIFDEPKLTFPLVVALFVLIPQVFSRIISGGLIGYRKIWQSNLVEQSLSTIITGILLLFIWISNWDISINTVAVIYGIGRICVTITIGLYWFRLRTTKNKKKFIPKKLLPTAYPLFVVSISTIVLMNADALVLGYLGDSIDVGLYTIAARIAVLTSFFLQITNSAVAPKIAALYEQGKIKELSKMIQKVTKILSFFGISTLLIFLFFGSHILSIWGEEFKEAYWMLVILGFGQFVLLASGAVGAILMMTGFEKTMGGISIVFCFVNILLLTIFINIWGAIGAALGTAISVIFQSIITIYFVRNRTGIVPIAFMKN